MYEPKKYDNYQVGLPPRRPLRIKTHTHTVVTRYGCTRTRIGSLHRNSRYLRIKEIQRSFFSSPVHDRFGKDIYHEKSKDNKSTRFLF